MSMTLQALQNAALSSLCAHPKFCNVKKTPSHTHFHMGVSKNRWFSPQIINFNWVFHYKPSILIGFSIILTIHFGGKPPIFGNTHIEVTMWCFTRFKMNPILTNLDLRLVFDAWKKFHKNPLSNEQCSKPWLVVLKNRGLYYPIIYTYGDYNKPI